MQAFGRDMAVVASNNRRANADIVTPICKQPKAA